MCVCAFSMGNWIKNWDLKEENKMILTNTLNLNAMGWYALATENSFV